MLSQDQEFWLSVWLSVAVVQWLLVVLLSISLPSPLFHPSFCPCPLFTLIGLPSFIAVHQWPSPHLININGKAITDLSDAGKIPGLQFLAYPNQSDHHH